MVSRDDCLVYPTKKRQLASPEPVKEAIQSHRCAGTISVVNGSSPAAGSSLSVLKLEHLTNHRRKPMLNSLGEPSENLFKCLCKPNLSAMVPPSDLHQHLHQC